MWRYGLIILICLPATLGCPSKSPAPSNPKTAPAPGDDASASANGGGSDDAAPSEDPATADLIGRITLDGEAPAPRDININKDRDTCGAAGTVTDVVVKDGGVAGVIVEIKGVKGEDWEFAKPEDGYVMRQKDCTFTPNTVVVPIGGKIEVFNDDPVAHNVNGGEWNEMQPAGAAPIVKPVESKMPSKISCNIHPWMEGWIYPASTPFYAVTDEQGNFSIEGVPPGKYRVGIWHPFLGSKTERMQMEAGKKASLEYEFAAVEQ